MIQRNTALAAAMAAVFGLAGAAAAQPAQPRQPGADAQQLNPSPMPPGSRAGDAPGMGGPNRRTGVDGQQVNPSPMPPGSRAGDAPGMGGTVPGTVGNTGRTPQQLGTDLSRESTRNDGPNGSPQTVGQGQATSAATLEGTGPRNMTGPNNADRGVPGGTGAAAPSGQPDVQRGTAPNTSGSRPGMAQAPATEREPALGAQGGAMTSPGMTDRPATGTGAASSDGSRVGAATPPATTTPGTTTPGATGATTPGASGEGGGTAPPAATTRHTEPRTAAAPVAGANSFTEGQARARMGDAGFTDVQGLRLDDQGIWRGRAMRNGQQTGVALDYQGNVVATPQ
jgi:hypothetical protein